MPDKKLISDKIVQQGILPLYFNADETVSIEVLRAIFKAGIRAVEYTNRGEAALNNFKKLVDVKSKEMPDMFLGVGERTLEQGLIPCVGDSDSIFQRCSNAQTFTWRVTRHNHACPWICRRVAVL